MVDVIIVSKTKMANDKVCVGGVDVDGCCSLRLLDEKGFHESISECPYNIWDVWEISYNFSKQRPCPHTEDVKVCVRKKKGVLKEEYRNISDFVRLLRESNVPVFNGSIIDCFDGKLQCTSNGTLFVNEENVPNYSTCFWICDRPLRRKDYNGKIRYNYNDGTKNWGYNISYVGLSNAVDIISRGSLIRLSLSHWWSPDDSEDEKRCYLQLSGILL